MLLIENVDEATGVMHRYHRFEEIPDRYATQVMLLDAAADNEGNATIPRVGHRFVEKKSENTVYLLSAVWKRVYARYNGKNGWSTRVSNSDE